MANRRIETKDIANPRLYDPLIDGAKNLLSQFKEIEKQLLAIAEVHAKMAKQTPLKGYEEIEEKEESIRKTRKALSELEKVEKQRASLQDKLASFESESVKRNEQLKLQLSERRKALKNEIKETTTVTGKYGQLNAKLARLRKEYKETAIEQGRNSKAAKELRGEIGLLSESLEKLDRDVKQQHREIGRYENAFKSLNKTLGKLGIISLVVGAFGALKDAFSANQEGADTLAKGIGRITITLRVFIQRLFAGASAFGNIFKQIGNSFKGFGLEIKLFFAELPGLMGGSVEKANELRKEIAQLDKEKQALAGQGGKALVETFKGMGEEIAELVKKNDELIDRTTKYRKIAIQLNQEIAGLNRELEKQRQLADDNTLSLEKQLAANEAALALSEQVAARNLQLAQNEVALAALRLETNKGSLEAREEYSQALIALTEAESEAEIVAAENAKRKREIERDNIELDLDQLIDLADRRKTINESIAKDERLSLERRSKAISDAITDIDKSFRAQAAKLQEGLEVSFNIDDLINETDTIKLNERIKAIGLDEIRQNRLREVLQERIQAVEDLRTAQDDLNKSQNEAREIEKDIIAQNEILKAIEEGRLEVGEALESLEKRRLQLAIENTEALLAQAEAGSVEQLKLQQRLNDLRLEQAQASADKEVDIEEKKGNELAEVAKETQALIADALEDRLDRQIEATEREIETAQRREDQLRELAAQGVQSAQESLVLEQQRRAQLELQRAQQEKKKALLELSVAAANIFSNSVQAGRTPGQAFAETVSATQLLRSFIESLPGFYEGTELVSRDLGKVIDGKDGYLTRVDGGERIIPSRINAMIPQTMSNEEAGRILSGQSVGAEVREIKRLQAEIRGVKDAIKSQETYKGMDFDKQNQAITFTIQSKNKIVRKHKRIGSVIG